MRRKRYHVVGVGGVGMSPLAELLLSLGHTVTGSDRAVDDGAMPGVVRKLSDQGLRLFPQDGSAVSSSLDAVVMSTAIEADNPELVSASRAKVPVLHRAAVLAEVANRHELIAVAGTCGKTTVTAMLGWIFEALGLDPVVVNGGATVGWDTESRTGSTRTGGVGPWIVEVDESDRSLLQFQPDWAVITNVSADHFSEAESLALFAEFAGLVSGPIVSWRDVQVSGVTFASTAGLAGRSFMRDGRCFEVPIPGHHNAENALISVLLCERFELDPGRVADALARFPGVRRRLELVGQHGGVVVVDDYGHNTMKIRAGLEAMQEQHPRVQLVWRPHGYGPLRAMLSDLADMFGAALRPADRLHLVPVYDAGGTADRSINSDALAGALAGCAADVCLHADLAAVQADILATAQPGDAVLVMGARDPGLPQLARRIAARLARTA